MFFGSPILEDGYSGYESLSRVRLLQIVVIPTLAYLSVHLAPLRSSRSLQTLATPSNSK
jgi:hypothetical protein